MNAEDLARTINTTSRDVTAYTSDGVAITFPTRKDSFVHLVRVPGRFATRVGKFDVHRRPEYLFRHDCVGDDIWGRVNLNEQILIVDDERVAERAVELRAALSAPGLRVVMLETTLTNVCERGENGGVKGTRLIEY